MYFFLSYFQLERIKYYEEKQDFINEQLIKQPTTTSSKRRTFQQLNISAIAARTNTTNISSKLSRKKLNRTTTVSTPLSATSISKYFRQLYQQTVDEKTTNNKLKKIKKKSATKKDSNNVQGQSLIVTSSVQQLDRACQSDNDLLDISTCSSQSSSSSSLLANSWQQHGKMKDKCESVSIFFFSNKLDNPK